MNTSFHSLLRLRLAPVALAWLLCSCAATSVKQTWKAPDHAGPVGTIAVLTVERDGMLRQGFENRFVKQLKQGGTAALTTFDLLTLPEIKQDKQAAAAKFRASGAEAVLILRLLAKTSAYHEYQPSDQRYVGTMAGADTMGWYDYYSYSMGMMNMSPSYGTTTEKLYLETSLYDLKTEKRVWSAMTKTVVSETMDRVGEMTPLVEKIIAAMRADGVIH